jgi:hypothetical protein
MAESCGMDRPTKISFGEMRNSGVRGLLVYCSESAPITSRLAAIDGPTTFGCLTAQVHLLGVR